MKSESSAFVLSGSFVVVGNSAQAMEGRESLGAQVCLYHSAFIPGETSATEQGGVFCLRCVAGWARHH